MFFYFLITLLVHTTTESHIPSIPSKIGKIKTAINKAPNTIFVMPHIMVTARPLLHPSKSLLDG